MAIFHTAPEPTTEGSIISTVWSTALVDRMELLLCSSLNLASTPVAPKRIRALFMLPSMILRDVARLIWEIICSLISAQHEVD